MKKFLAVSLLLSFNAFAGFKPQPKVIYGDDDRHELYEITDQKILAVAHSTVALIKKRDLQQVGDLLQIDQSTFQQTMNVCSHERFASQPNPAFCSGFLIAPNKMVTAGHCIKDDSDCAATQFVFDFSMINQSSAKTQFSSNQIYSCKKILGRNQESTGLDFAIIEIDRLVLDRVPVILSSNENLRTGDKLFVIGHPSGLPLKITDNANVRNVNDSAGFFQANLDTYGGNSGSAVFNAVTYEVEGILVRGENDFVTDPSSSCEISNRVANDAGRGEDSTMISKIVENGNVSEPSEPEPPSSPTGTRYVYLSSDNTCNEFNDDGYVREVPMSYCSDAPAPRYVWLDSDNTCNEFRGDAYIREVANSYCGR